MTSFGIGILIGKKWEQFQLRKIQVDPELEEISISGLEKIEVKLGILMLKKLGIKRGKSFIIWTNNTTTKAAVQKWKSRDRLVNREWKEIKNLMVRLEIYIKARKVLKK